MNSAEIEKFADSMVSFLKKEAPEAVEKASDGEIHEFAARCVRRAAPYGIDEVYLLEQFVLFSAWLGEDFDTSERTPWSAAILRDKSLSADDRMSKIEDYIMTQWEGAK